MITFVTTFPPIICGIATYTKYILDHVPPAYWRVISLNLDGFSVSDDALAPDMKDRVDYCLSFPNPTLPPLYGTNVLWFQHAFGMWGNINEPFLGLLKEAKRRKINVAASFHTIHFQSEETPSGMSRKEEDLLREALPFLDVLTVFTDGACQAVLDAFPEYGDKIVILRHGVHLYPGISLQEARERLYSYLVNQAKIPISQKEELDRIKAEFHSKDTVLLGNYGFITPDKGPSRLYELGKLVRKRLPHHRVITLFAGIIQGTRDDTLHHTRMPVLESLRANHDGKENFFFEVYIPEDILPIAIKALDFAVFWCNNATQSGRMAHAQGTGALVVGRDIEGIGETLKGSGLPAAGSLNELAETIVELVLDSNLKKEALDKAWQYAQRYCFANQAKKHLLIERALTTGTDLPALDGEEIKKFSDWKREDIYKTGNFMPTPLEAMHSINKKGFCPDHRPLGKHQVHQQGEKICTLQ